MAPSQTTMKHATRSGCMLCANLFKAFMQRGCVAQAHPLHHPELSKHVANTSPTNINKMHLQATVTQYRHSGGSPQQAHVAGVPIIQPDCVQSPARAVWGMPTIGPACAQSPAHTVHLASLSAVPGVRSAAGVPTIAPACALSPECAVRRVRLVSLCAVASVCSAARACGQQCAASFSDHLATLSLPLVCAARVCE